MTWVFFGTDEFAVIVLQRLVKLGFKPNLLVTTPDKPRGRKLILTPPPVKVWAQENNIKFIQPASLKNFNSSELKAENYDFFLVASYGKIIPENILDISTHGTLNIHPSLLPKYRGPSPLETAILAGEKETGVSIMKLDSEMDHGPVLIQEKISLADQKDYLTLRQESAEKGAELLVKILPVYLEGKILPYPQDHLEATYTHKFSKADGEINLGDDPLTNYRKYLAFKDWPGVFFFENKNGKKVRLKITAAHLDDGRLVIDKVIPEGKREISWKEYSQN